MMSPPDPATPSRAIRAGLRRAWPARLMRPALHVETLVLLTMLFLMLAGNGPFWRAVLAGRGWDALATWGFAAALMAAFSAFYFAFVALVSSRHTVKPLLTVLVLCTAFASYYMERYAIYLDRPMLRNVLATNYKEARELFSWSLLPHVLALGLLPVALLWWPRLRRRSLGRALLVRLGSVAVALAVGVGGLLLVFADFASLMRNRGEVRYLITPGNVVASLAGNAFGRARRPSAPPLTVGGDARLAGAWADRKRPALFVLVVGETARSQNFSLNGYARQTNPLLARQDVISYPNATACGTSTEVSLPCMFSPFGRRHYNEEKILTHESLLHVLARAGFQVLWRDNQSGCKGVCAGLPVEQLDHAPVPALCADGQCLDEILLKGLDGVARDAKGNLFVVMHQMGSHGPAYFRRYPPAFKRFTPACENEDLRHCSAAEILNAYDNSLLYTDFFVSGVIDFLAQAQARYDTALLYVSDHGESLGEGGLYLHGMPYAIAPDVQKRVPFVLWLSPAFRRNFAVDPDCLRARARQEVSHDHLFHSLLGVLDVSTAAHDPAMDLFAPCRPAAAATAATAATPNAR